MNWTDAFAFCASRGGSLPVLNTRCINDNFIPLFPATVWTAGTRLQPYSSVPSQWQWATNLSSPGEAFYNGNTTAGTCLSFCAWGPWGIDEPGSEHDPRARRVPGWQVLQLGHR